MSDIIQICMLGNFTLFSVSIASTIFLINYHRLNIYLRFSSPSSLSWLIHYVIEKIPTENHPERDFRKARQNPIFVTKTTAHLIVPLATAFAQLSLLCSAEVLFLEVEGILRHVGYKLTRSAFKWSAQWL